MPCSLGRRAQIVLTQAQLLAFWTFLPPNFLDCSGSFQNFVDVFHVWLGILISVETGPGQAALAIRELSQDTLRQSLVVPDVEGAGVEGVLYGGVGLQEAEVELVEFDVLDDLLLPEEPADDGHLHEFFEVLQSTCAFLRDRQLELAHVYLDWMDFLIGVGDVFVEEVGRVPQDHAQGQKTHCLQHRSHIIYYSLFPIKPITQGILNPTPEIYHLRPKSIGTNNLLASDWSYMVGKHQRAEYVILCSFVSSLEYQWQYQENTSLGKSIAGLSKLQLGGNSSQAIMVWFLEAWDAFYVKLGRQKAQLSGSSISLFSLLIYLIFYNQEMKGIPIQLEGIINFIDMTLQNKTLSQTYDCYLLNLEKAVLDTLKVANIAFDHLDSHVPADVRVSFQKTTNKIKEYIKNKPKEQLEAEDDYLEEFDEIQNYLENRPEILRTDEKERGELYKFLHQAEEKQKQNRLLLENVPKFSYRIYSDENRNYFSDIRTLLENHNNPKRIRCSKMLSSMFKKQIGGEHSKNDSNVFKKPPYEEHSVQTELTMAELEQVLMCAGKYGSQQILQRQMMIGLNSEENYNSACQPCSRPSICKKKSKYRSYVAEFNQKSAKNVECSEKQLGLSQHNQKPFSKTNIKEPIRDENARFSELIQSNDGTQYKIQTQSANVQQLELTKLDIKDKKLQTKGILKGKANDKKQTKLKNKDSFQKVNKAKSKQNSSWYKSASNISSNNEGQYKRRCKEIQTQTENICQIQSKQKQEEGSKLEILKEDELQGIQSVKKKSSSLQRPNSLSQLYSHKNTKSKEFTKRERETSKVQRQKQGEDLQKSGEVGRTPKHNPFQGIIKSIYRQGEQNMLPSLAERTSKLNRYESYTNNLSNLSFNNLRESADSKEFSKNKLNLSQLHHSIHSNLTQHLQQRYGNSCSSLFKKDNQKLLEMLPVIRQDSEYQHQKTRDVLSKGKEQQLERQTKRLLEEIQQGSVQKKGRKVEWVKVIRNIRQYENMHFKYCGQSCVHLHKFYEFLKKRNLNMYINRKQLYLHKHNIEIKPNLP